MFVQLSVFAQTHSYFIYKKIIPSTDSILIDSNAIDMSSLQIIVNNNQIKNTPRFSKNGNFLYTEDLRQYDSITICYKRLPALFFGSFYNKKSSLMQSNGNSSNVIFDNSNLAYYSTKTKDEIQFSSLDYNGIFGRGISFGNNQDVVLNSQFNLQLSGSIGNDIEINAAITDNQIPLQPEGNTQQIQDFDKIFIQFKRRNASIIVGDYFVSKPESYFLNINKKLQGIDYSNVYKISDSTYIKQHVSGAIARGIFTINTFQGTEGNQGPYKLTGKNGENFIIILSASERVYIDGILLQRGEDLDYVVDYNVGELRFTPNRIITKDMRIRVEFEYTDRQYFRSFLLANQTLKYKSGYFYVNGIQVQDSKNQTLDIDLSPMQKQLISDLGDNINNTYIPSEREVSLTANNKVLYIKKDTLINGIVYNNIFAYSTLDTAQLYNVTFSDVGVNNGNYVRDITNANGRIYRFVAPVNGVKQGQYEPLIKINAPQQQQLFTIGGNQNIQKNTTIKYETALSKIDLNRFSTIDKKNDYGFATMLQIENKNTLNYTERKKTQLISGLQYEFVNQYFQAVEPYRNVEFARDWNTQTYTNKQFEHIVKAYSKLSKPQNQFVQYDITAYIRGNEYKAIRNQIAQLFKLRHFTLSSNTAFTQSKSSIENTSFLRPTLALKYQHKKWTGIETGIQFVGEHNVVKLNTNKALTNKSFDFKEYKYYISTNDSNTISSTLSYTYRTDDFVKKNSMKRATNGHTASVQVNINGLKNQQIQLTSALRKVIIADSTLFTNKVPDYALLARIDYNSSIKKGFIRLNTMYQINGSQEPKLEFAYVEVRAGQGNFTWNDYNNDGVAQINEFEVAYFSDRANYIRVSNNTNNYIATNAILFNQSIQINPKIVCKKSTQTNRILREITSLFNMQMERKTANVNNTGEYNPFNTNVSDTLLLTYRHTFRHSLFFQRGNPKFGFEYSINKNAFKNNLIIGYEQTNTMEHVTRLRVGITDQIISILNSSLGNKKYDSEFYNQRDYILQIRKIEPEIIYTFKNKFRAGASFQYNFTQNAIQQKEKLNAQQLKVEMKYSAANSATYALTFSFIKNNYTGSTNTPIAYTMLNGLQRGNNYVWNVSIQRKLNNAFELILSYDGRKSGENIKIIHTGNAQIRAVF